MEIIHKIKTKAKWQLAVHPTTSMPILGYYKDIWPYGYCDKTVILLPAGNNLILFGKLYLNGFSRGRSAVKFHFKDKNGHKFLFSTSGINDVLEGISYGNLSADNEYVNGESAPYIEGKFTCVKQGSDVTLSPVIPG